MPYLHLDLPGTYPIEVKRELATRLCKLYAEVMETQLWRPNVGIAELGKDNLLSPRFRRRCHSPSRYSCRVVSPIRDARFVDLILQSFMCNSGRRQERVWRAQRPRAKIHAIATSAGGRDRTSPI